MFDRWGGFVGRVAVFVGGNSGSARRARTSVDHCWSDGVTGRASEHTGSEGDSPLADTLGRMSGRRGSTPDGLLEVGRIGRAHGIRGDVFIDLTTDRVERAAVGSRLWARGRWVTITESHPSSRRWRVHLDGVDDRNAAEALAGTPLFAEPIDDPDAMWVHHLIGAAVIEANGIDRGRCVAVIENPASDLLELESGALVPAVFVLSVDVSGGVPLVTIDPPEGLFDLGEGG